MKRRRHTPEQIIRKLREAERLIGESKTIAEATNELGISEQISQRGRTRARAATIAASPARLRRSARDDGRASPTTIQV